MTSPMPSLRVEQIVDAHPEAVARAIASPYGLSAWMCDEARSEMRPEGRLLLRWHDGRQAAGRWSQWAPPERLAFYVLGDDGAEHAADFALSATEDGGTRLVAEIAEPGVADDRAAAEAGWDQRLTDLAALAEQGLRARAARRPMLGIWPDDDVADGGPGAAVGGVVEWGSAAKAGVARGDMITAIADQAIGSWGQLLTTLQDFSAGEEVTVTVRRGGREQELAMTLVARPQPDVSTDPGELEQRMEALMQRLEGVLDGLEPEEADFRPAEGAWSIREVLGHLIASERIAQLSLQALALEEDPVRWPGGPDTLLQRVLRHRPLSELRETLMEDLRLSTGLALKVLEADADPAMARAVGEELAHTALHVNDHVGQMADNRAAARQTQVQGG